VRRLQKLTSGPLLRGLLASFLDLLVENRFDLVNQFQDTPFLFWREIDEWSLFREVAQRNTMIFHTEPLI